jgi:predicted dehydrogenase
MLIPNERTVGAKARNDAKARNEREGHADSLLLVVCPRPRRPLLPDSRFRVLSRFRSSLPERRFALSRTFALSQFLSDRLVPRSSRWEVTMGKGRIGLGVIGVNATNMGSTVRLLREVPDLRYDVRAIGAARAEPLAALAREWEVPFHTTDYRALVERPDVDVVAVYSPDHLHAEHCLAALAAGKHVICTKPMVTGLEDARELVRAVRRSGRKFLVGQTMRFDRQFLTLRHFVERGDLGKLRVAQAHYVHDMRPIYQLTPWRLEAPQDLMYGGIVHVADILRSFCGDVTEVHAFANHGTLTPKYPMEDNYLLNLRFESGVIGQGVGLYGLV